MESLSHPRQSAMVVILHALHLYQSVMKGQGREDFPPSRYEMGDKNHFSYKYGLMKWLVQCVQNGCPGLSGEAKKTKK